VVNELLSGCSAGLLNAILILVESLAFGIRVTDSDESHSLPD